MKQFLTLLLFISALTIHTYAQQVDIRVAEVTTDNVLVQLSTDTTWNSILSSIVFTMKWPVGQGSMFQQPVMDPPHASISASGDVWVNNGYMYQVYAGFGFSAVNIQPAVPISINIGKEGSFNPEIADDLFVFQDTVNGAFYISIGGQDVTGSVLDPLLPTSVIRIDKPEQLSNLFWDPLSSQLLILQDSSYFTLLGKWVSVPDKFKLVSVSYVK